MIVNYFVFGQRRQLPIILKIDTRKVPEDNNTFTVATAVGSLGNLSIYSYRVDWGDGVVEDGNTGNASHTYNIPGEYIVKIYGTFPRFYFRGAIYSKKLIEVISWGNVEFENNQEFSFYGCSNLTSIAGGAAWFKTLTHAHGMFSGCGLTELPEDMTLDSLIDGGRNNTGGGVFNGCRLKQLPPAMKLDNLETAVNMFAGALFNSLPTGMKLNKLTQGGYMFYNNINLTDISPLELNSLENGDSMFRNNTKITSIPEIMTLDNLVNGAGMFQYCKLTHLPANMKLDNLESAGTGNSNGSMFGSNKLTDLPVGITLRKLSGGVGMFSGNAINTERYSKLLIDMEVLNSNNSVVFHGGNSKYNSSAAAAKNALLSRGWTITDLGQV